MPSLRRIGQEAEDQAARYLVEQGLTLVTRRYSVRGGEIDLIAMEEDIVVFVEVKARSGDGMSPEEAIDARKVRRMSLAAQRYLEDVGERNRTVRFDLVAIDAAGVRHYRDYFRSY